MLQLQAQNQQQLALTQAPSTVNPSDSVSQSGQTYWADDQEWHENEWYRSEWYSDSYYASYMTIPSERKLLGNASCLSSVNLAQVDQMILKDTPRTGDHTCAVTDRDLLPKLDQELHAHLSETNYPSSKLINMEYSPTYAIVDTGCTRAMSSWSAMKKFIAAMEPLGTTFEWQKCHTVMKFADSGSAVLEYCVHIRFPSGASTTIDIHPKGNVPILMSLFQLRHLRIALNLDDDGIFYSSKVLGIHHQQMPISTSKHLVFDMRILCRPGVAAVSFLAQSGTSEGNKIKSARQTPTIPVRNEVSPPIHGCSVRSHPIPGDSYEKEKKLPSRTIPDCSKNHTYISSVLDLDLSKPEGKPTYEDCFSVTLASFRKASKLPVPRKTARAKSEPKKKKTSDAPTRVKGDHEAPFPDFPTEPPGSSDGVQPRKGLRRVRSKSAPPEGYEVPARRLREKTPSIQSTRRPVSTLSKPLADGDEPEATAPTRRIHDKLRDRATLLRLHLQHYHMSVPSF